GTPDGTNTGYLKPTPLTYSLVVSVQDMPLRSSVDPNFLYQALFTPVSVNPDHFTLVGDALGTIPIQSITFTSDAVVNGSMATGFLTISFYEALPDDRYTLTIADGVTDRVGNALDGEANTNEPHDSQTTLPSGDIVPGGDFVARFTVDSRPEIGTWSAGSAYVDTNGNWTFDPTNADFTNRDIQYSVRYTDNSDMFYTSDDVFAGKFTTVAGVGNDGFDRLGAYGMVGGVYRWLIDTDNDGVADLRVVDPRSINGLPVAGNFDGNKANGDEVGVFNGVDWWIDTNHDYKVDFRITSGLRGLPIVGDFDGDGMDDLGTWADDQLRFDFASNGLGALSPEATINFGFIGVRERPFASDMDMDGIDDVGLMVPDRSGQTPAESPEWYMLISNTFGVAPAAKAANYGTAAYLSHAFTPVPFGRDLFASYGDEYALPVVGNFDPPVTPAGSGGSGGGTTDPTTYRNPLDVDGDGFVAPIDALLVVNALNRGETTPSQANGEQAPPYLDVDSDGVVAPIDVLQIVNYLNSAPSVNGEGESAAVSAADLNFSVNVSGIVDTDAADEEEEVQVTTAATRAAAPVVSSVDDLFADAGELADATDVDSALDAILGDVADNLGDDDARGFLFGKLV
ncbi:MAG TPA: dockerin type I domain-containing protein, partial [Pirellulaceae bacterium]|nr:dockerin type I domain-containing protein [Pirellulaceae bacterium]